MKDQVARSSARSRVSRILSPVLFLLISFSLCFSQTQSDPKKQPQGVPTQKTDFVVGKNPDAIIFDGAHIWVANQLGDNVMKLSASDGANLGTFPTGSKPVALAFDGESIWVANKFSHNVMKLNTTDGSLIDTIKVGRSP